MADAFSTASSDIENQRRAAVAAIAAGGSAGAANFAAAQQQIAGSRTAALNAALADSAARGITPAQQQEFAGTIGRPYDLLNSASVASAASHAAQNAQLGAASGDYFNQLNAAVPMARENLLRTIAAQQAKNQLSDSELRTRLAGAGEGLQGQALSDARNLGNTAEGKLTEAEKAYRSFAASLKYGSTSNSGPVGPAGPLGPQGPKNKQGVSVQGDSISREDASTLSRLAQQVIQARQNRQASKQAIADVKAKPITDYSRQAGIDSGLDQNLVRGLIKPGAGATPKPASQYRAVSDAAAQVGIRPKVLARITAPSASGDPTPFQIGAKAAQAAIKDGVSVDTFTKDMNQYLPKKAGRTKALILAIYGPAFTR